MESITPEFTAKEAPEPRRPATFFGTAYHKVSARGNQVAMPKHMLKSIEHAGEGQLLLVRWNNEGFLRMYTQDQMNQRIEQIQGSALPAQAKTELKRKLSSNAIPIEPDSQGRFVLPSHWVEALNLRDEIAFCGVHKRVEIWPAEARREAERKEREQSPEATELVTEILDF